MRFFWMNRNEEGLNEYGYPLTFKQLTELFSVEPVKNYFDLNGFLSGNTFEYMEGAAWGNDTFSIKEVTMEELKDLMTWKDFDPQESHASGSFDEEYPDFVDEKYRLSRYIYNFTGYTERTLPYTDRDNHTYDFLLAEFGLTDADTCYSPTNEEKAAKDIAECIRETGTIQRNGYLSILLTYDLVKPVGVQAYPYASQYGIVKVPECLKDEEVEGFLKDSWNLIHFKPAELDYCGTDFEWEWEDDDAHIGKLFSKEDLLPGVDYSVDVINSYVDGLENELEQGTGITQDKKLFIDGLNAAMKILHEQLKGMESGEISRIKGECDDND